MKELVIIGAGDVGRFVAYHFSGLSEFRVIGFLDDDKSKWGTTSLIIPCWGIGRTNQERDCCYRYSES